MRVNKEWNEKYLSGIESAYNKHLTSPLQNIPKKFNTTSWKTLILWILIGSIVFSFGFAMINNCFDKWICEWFSNLFLNLALGMTASLIILLYTERKEKTIRFYDQNLKLLKERHEQLHRAFFESFGKIQRNVSFHRMKEATDDAFNSFECFFCSINFFEFLFDNFDEVPEPLSDITKEQIDLAKSDALKLYKEMETKATANGFLSEEDLSRVITNGDIIYSLLNKFKQWIDITENGLYGIKYGNEKDNGIGGESK